MVKEAILRAITHTLIISMLLIIPTIAPIYLISGLLSRQLVDKSN